MTAPTSRKDVKAAYSRALETYGRTVLRDLRREARQAGRDGKNALMVFDVRDNSDATEGDVEVAGAPREELVAVALADQSGVTRLTREIVSPQRWSGLVELWDDTRDMLGAAGQTEIPPCLVVDLDEERVAAFEALYCPDESDSPECDILADIPTGAGSDGDEFDAFLADLAAEAGHEDDAEDRLNMLLEEYGLDAPGRPAHARGQCQDGYSD